MADKLIATIRFNTEGAEADLYQKIQGAKRKPDYQFRNM